MRTASYSTPGKIHLIGEHSVVYGKPAILSAINLRVRVSLLETETKQHFSGELLRLKRIVEGVVKKEFKVSIFPHYELNVTSQIPIGSGLGSSAAVCASYIACLLDLLGEGFNTEVVNKLTFEVEKTFHGNPSGGDNTTVVYGGTIWYRNEVGIVKLFSALPFLFHIKTSKFLLLDSGHPKESTLQMVENVKSLHERKRKSIEKILDSQEQLAKSLVVALRDGESEDVIQLIRQSERNLEKLGVVGLRARSIIRMVEKLGGAAKILGGGGYINGSGMIMAYSLNLVGLEETLKDKNIPILKVSLGESGIRKE